MSQNQEIKILRDGVLINGEGARTPEPKPLPETREEQLIRMMQEQQQQFARMQEQMLAEMRRQTELYGTKLKTGKKDKPVCTSESFKQHAKDAGFTVKGANFTDITDYLSPKQFKEGTLGWEFVARTKVIIAGTEYGGGVQVRVFVDGTKGQPIVGIGTPKADTETPE